MHLSESDRVLQLPVHLVLVPQLRAPGAVLLELDGDLLAGGADAEVDVAEGTAAAAKMPFNNTRRVVRQWRQETTSDGRTIQVPVDIEVDAYGRPVKAPKAVGK